MQQSDLISTIASFRVFDSAMVMTQGGPSNATLFYVYHLVNRAFTYGQFGYASAMAGGPASILARAPTSSRRGGCRRASPRTAASCTR